MIHWVGDIIYSEDLNILYSPVKIRKKHLYPEQIPRKLFVVVFGSIIFREKHIKSSPKFDHHRGSKYDIKRNGRQGLYSKKTNYAYFNMC